MMPPRPREIALTAAFVSLAVGGSLIEQIPNVEILTMTVFLSGALLGPLAGLLTGALSAFLFSTLNPLGQASPPLLAAQIISLAICGAVGGLPRVPDPASIRGRLALGLCGLAVTLVYDLLTTISFTLVVDLNWKAFVGALAFGAPFYALHLLSNTLIFAFILPILIPRLSTLRVFANLRPLPSKSAS
jgi:hypothetical protein